MNLVQSASRIATATSLVATALMLSAPGHALGSQPLNVVTTTADSGPGSLRDTIANAPAGAIISFALTPNSTIVLTSGPLVIDRDLTLTGNPPANNVTLSGNDADRVIVISAPVTVTIDALTVTRGRVKSPCDFGPSQGGGIYATGGVLTVLNSVITGNQASCLAAAFPVGSGGGIFTQGSLNIHNSRIESNRADGITGGAGGVSAVGALTMSKSVVAGNIGDAAIRAKGDATIDRSVIHSNSGDGIEAAGPSASINATQVMSNSFWGIVNSSVLTVTNSTISANAGGGLYNMGKLALVNSTVSGNGGLSWFGAAFGGLWHAGSHAFIASSTIVNNTSGDSAARSGIIIDNGVVEMQNSIVAGNGITNNFAISTSASLVSLGYNLTNGDGVLTATGDLSGATVVLGPLAANGGSTPTHALAAGSAGIDDANPAGCTDATGAALANDQRGYPRSADGDGDGQRRCDIGAYESWVPTNTYYLPFSPVGP